MKQQVKILHIAIQFTPSKLLLLLLLMQLLVGAQSLLRWLYKCKTINKLLGYIYHRGIYRRHELWLLLLIIISCCVWSLGS
jgi:hypothetical protein